MNDINKHNERGLPIDNRDIIKERIDSGTELIRSTADMFQSAESCLSTIDSCIHSVNELISNAGETIIAYKEIDKAMLTMELKFNLLCKEMDVNLSKYKTKIPIIEKQIDSINSNMTKILDFVLTMDANTEKEISFRDKMIEKIGSFMQITMVLFQNLL